MMQRCREAIEQHAPPGEKANLLAVTQVLMPDNLLGQVQFIVGRSGVLRVIEFRRPVTGDPGVPVMAISTPDASVSVDIPPRPEPPRQSPPALLAIAQDLLRAGQTAAAAVLGRAALDVHVQAMIDGGALVIRSKPAIKLRHRVSQLRECGAIDRVTAGAFNHAIDVGNAGAHGRPVVAADVLAALVGLRAGLGTQA
jgi:hypothetical protein